MSEAYAFRFVPEICIHCSACETACKIWNGTENGVKLRRFVSGFTGIYPNPAPVSLSVACLHCDEPACAEVCPVGAISKGEDGIVRTDTGLGVGCRACLAACPVDAPQFGADGLMRKCDLCGAGLPACVSVCPTQALTLERVSRDEKLQLDAEAAARFQTF